MNWFKQFWKGLTEPAPGARRITDHAGSSRTETRKGGELKFTPRAEQVFVFARKEAEWLNHNFVGTEHVLLGIIKLGEGTAVDVLRKAGLDLDKVRQEVEAQVGTGPDQKLIGNIPFTPRVKKVIALAQKEAQQLNQTTIGSEHILLGLLREGDGVGARVLTALGVELEKTRQEILRAGDPNVTPEAASSAKAGEGGEAARPWTAGAGFTGHLTPRAGEVFRLACEEARNLKRSVVGTEHLLLGLIGFGKGIAAGVLARADLNLETVRSQVKKTEGANPDKNTGEITGCSEGVKTVMALAQREADQLGHTYIGTEHLLLGLLEAGDDVAARIMKDLGVDRDQMRKEILRDLDPNSGQPPKERTVSEAASDWVEKWHSKWPKPDPVDLSRRYDVYCIQHGEVVVHRNVLLKGVKGLFASHGADLTSLYLEMEQPDGKAIFLPKHSVFKFCDPGTNAGGGPNS